MTYHLLSLIACLFRGQEITHFTSGLVTFNIIPFTADDIKFGCPTVVNQLYRYGTVEQSIGLRLRTYSLIIALKGC